MKEYYPSTKLLLAMEGECFLDEARHFAIQHLSKYLISSGDEIICIMVRHALELLLHWRMPRLEVRWFIDLYRRKSELNPSICIEENWN